MSFKDVGAPRLLELADILDKADEEHEKKGEPLYRQMSWGHPCGTPACAMGHWAVSEEGSKRWKLSADGLAFRATGYGCDTQALLQREFFIDDLGVTNLFGGYGCGNATTGKEAAKYIRDFVFEELSCEAQQ